MALQPSGRAHPAASRGRKLGRGIFLSYAREDYNAVSAIYDRLKDLGLKPWMDKRDLLPGQLWNEVIYSEVQRSDFVLVFLSSQSVDKRGVFQR